LTDLDVDLSDDRSTIHFGYSNLCDRQWQWRQGSALLGNDRAPAVFRGLLPRTVLSARHASNRLKASKLR
jgi:hypothetical protein